MVITVIGLFVFSFTSLFFGMLVETSASETESKLDQILLLYLCLFYYTKEKNMNAHAKTD